MDSLLQGHRGMAEHQAASWGPGRGWSWGLGAPGGSWAQAWGCSGASKFLLHGSLEVLLFNRWRRAAESKVQLSKRVLGLVCSAGRRTVLSLTPHYKAQHRLRRLKEWSVRARALRDYDRRRATEPC